jgi:hypothetical protein
MRLVEQVGGKKISIIITLILTTYQLIRVIAFVNIYGGVEHDSGWALGVARSLAERGIYTSMVSTIVDPAVPGDLNVDKVFKLPMGASGFAPQPAVLARLVLCPIVLC